MATYKLKRKTFATTPAAQPTTPNPTVTNKFSNMLPSKGKLVGAAALVGGGMLAAKAAKDTKSALTGDTENFR